MLCCLGPQTISQVSRRSSVTLKRTLCSTTAAASPSSPLQKAEFWDAMESVGGYDKSLFGYFCGRMAAKLVGRYQPLTSSDRVLDVGAGTGAVALGIASRHSSVSVSAVDVSPVMVDRLVAKADDAGIPNVSASVCDGQSLPEDWDSSFDAVFSCLSLIFYPDQHKGLTEMHRVLKPGGLVVVASWAPLSNNPALTPFYASLDAAVKDKLQREGKYDEATYESVLEKRNPNFSLSVPKVLADAIQSAGFEKPSVAKLWHTFEGDTEDYLSLANAAAATSFPADDPAFAEVFADTFTKLTDERMKGVGRRLTACVNVGIAAKP